MKAGDILVSSTCSLTSWGIRISTISKFSHAALAISDHEIIEATPAGVLRASLDSFTSANTRVLLLKRPETLTEDQLLKLTECANKKEGLDYNLIRTLNSGFSHFGLSFAFSTLIAGAILFLYNKQYLYALYLFLAMAVPIGLLFISANPEKSNKIFKKLCIPKSWLTDLNKHFCSQLVFDLDSEIGGNLKKSWNKPYEPRPKDIKKLAIQMGFTPVEIKHNTKS